jgi:hypothetical protein
MLNELKQVLDLFEWVTDEFQANDVMISSVYPCVVSFMSKRAELLKFKEKIFKYYNSRHLLNFNFFGSSLLD